MWMMIPRPNNNNNLNEESILDVKKATIDSLEIIHSLLVRCQIARSSKLAQPWTNVIRHQGEV